MNGFEKYLKETNKKAYKQYKSYKVEYKTDKNGTGFEKYLKATNPKAYSQYQTYQVPKTKVYTATDKIIKAQAPQTSGADSNVRPREIDNVIGRTGIETSLGMSGLEARLNPTKEAAKKKSEAEYNKEISEYEKQVKQFALEEQGWRRAHDTAREAQAKKNKEEAQAKLNNAAKARTQKKQQDLADNERILNIEEVYKYAPETKKKSEYNSGNYDKYASYSRARDSYDEYFNNAALKAQANKYKEAAKKYEKGSDEYTFYNNLARQIETGEKKKEIINSANNLRLNKDFAEKSKYKKTGTTAFDKDNEYEWVNGKATSHTPLSGPGYVIKYENLTPEQVENYNYLYATRGKDKAREYLDAVGIYDAFYAFGSGYFKPVTDMASLFFDEKEAYDYVTEQNKMQEAHPFAYKAGSTAGGITEMVMIGSTGGVLGGSKVAAKIAGKLGIGATKAIETGISAATMAGLTAKGEYAPMKAGIISKGQYGSDVLSAGIGGAAGHIASGLTNTGLMKALSKNGFWTPFKLYVKNVASGTAFAIGNAGTSALSNYTISGKEISGEDMARELVMGFTLSAVFGYVSTQNDIEKANKAFDNLLEIQKEWEAILKRGTNARDVSEFEQYVNDIHTKINDSRQILQDPKSIKLEINKENYENTLKAFDIIDKVLDSKLAEVKGEARHSTTPTTNASKVQDIQLALTEGIKGSAATVENGNNVINNTSSKAQNITVDELYKMATPVQEKLNNTVRGVANEMGLKYEDSTQKSVKSMNDKLQRKHAEGKEYGLMDMKDHTRTKLEMNKFDQIPDVLDRLEARNIPFKTEYVHGGEYGYRGFHVTWVNENGITSELQLTTPEAWPLKLWSDGIYDKWRDVKDYSKLSASDLIQMKNDIKESNERWNALWNQLGNPDLSAYERASASDNFLPNQISSKETGLDLSPEITDTNGVPTQSSFATRPSSKSEYDTSDIVNTSVNNSISQGNNNINNTNETDAKLLESGAPKALVDELNALGIGDNGKVMFVQNFLESENLTKVLERYTILYHEGRNNAGEDSKIFNAYAMDISDGGSDAVAVNALMTGYVDGKLEIEAQKVAEAEANRLPETIEEIDTEIDRIETEMADPRLRPESIARYERQLDALEARREELANKQHTKALGNTSNKETGSKENTNNNIRFSIEPEVTSAITQEQMDKIVERAFNALNIKDYSDYKTSKEWINDISTRELALTIESEYDVYQYAMRYASEALREGDVEWEDVIDAYKAGALIGSKTQSKSKALDVAKDYKVDDNRFYSNSKKKNISELIDKANRRASGKDSDEIYKARSQAIIALHDRATMEAAGMTDKDVNALIRKWTRYPVSSKELSLKLNENVGESNRWTGIENTALINAYNISDEEFSGMVKSVKGARPNDFEKAYIAETMLAIDTHTDWSWLSFEFDTIDRVNEKWGGGNKDVKRCSGYYNGSERNIVVAYGRDNTVAHEMGHALDNKWANDILGYEEWTTNELSKLTEGQINKISDANKKQFAINFNEFIDGICEKSDIRNAYYQSRNEVFARFVAKFVEWTNNKGVPASWGRRESYVYVKDSFDTNDYISFVKLLQEKAAIDSSEYVKNGTYQAEIREDQGNTHNLSGEERYNILKKPNEVTENDVRGLIDGANSGKFENGTYIPMSAKTPKFFADVINEYEKTKIIDSKLSLATTVQHLLQSMEEDEGSNNGTDRGHSLSEDGIIKTIKKIAKPDYIVKQKNGRYAAVVSVFDRGRRDVVVAIDPANSDNNYKQDNVMNGYEAGYYNIVVTTYTPDSLKSYLNKCKIIYNKKTMNGKYHGGSGRVVAISHESPFNDMIPDKTPNVKPNLIEEPKEIKKDNLDIRKDQLKELRELKKRNADLEKSRDYWKGQTKTTPYNAVNEKEVEALDRKYRDNTTLKKGELADDIRKLGEHFKSKDLNAAVATEMATELAKKIVDADKGVIDTAWEEEVTPLKDWLRKVKVQVNKMHKPTDFYKKGGLGRSLAGKGIYIHFAETGEGLKDGYTGIDQWWQESHLEHPEWFTDEAISEGDMIDEIVQLVDLSESIERIPLWKEIGYDNAIESTCSMIFEDMLNISGASKTYADRAQERINRLKTEKQTAINTLRAERDQKIANLKQHYKDKAADKRANRIDSEARTRLLKTVKRLNKMKVSTPMRAVLDEMIGDIDTVAKGITGKSLEKLGELDAWVKERIENDPDFIPTKKTIDSISRINKKHIADMDIDDVRDLTDALLNIEHTIRTEKEFIDSKIKHDLYVSGMETITNIDNAKTPGGILKGIRKYIADETLTPVRQAKRLTGYANDDPLAIAVEEMQEGEVKKIKYEIENGNRFNKWTNDKKFKKTISGKEATRIEIEGLDAKGNPTKVSITPAMRMGLYLHSRNDQNLRHIRDGGVTVPDWDLYIKGKINEAYTKGSTIRLTPSAINAITLQMSAKERAFADEIARYCDESGAPLSAAYEMLNGYALRTVKNYYPIDTDKSFLGTKFDELKFDGSIESLGSLKERTGAINPIMLYDADTVADRLIKQHAKYINMAVPVRNFNKLFGINKMSYDEENKRTTYESSLQREIKAKWGKGAYNYFEKLISDLSNNRNDISSFSRAMSAFRSNFAKSTLELNASVMIKQAASYLTAVSVLGYGPVMKAFKNVGSMSESYVKKMFEVSPLQAERERGFSTQEIGELTEKGKPQKKALNWIQAMDIWTTRKLFKASEYYVRDNFKDLKVGSDEYWKKVGEIHTKVLQETQPMYTTMNRPQLLRSKSELEKSVHMFKTQPFQNFNILYDAIGELGAAKRAYKNSNSKENQKWYKKAQKTAARAVSSQIVSSFVFALMQYAWDVFRGKDKKYKDEEGEYTLASFAKGMGLNMLSNGAGMVPFGSVVAELGETITDLILEATGKDPLFESSFYGLEDNTLAALTNLGTSTVNVFKDTIDLIGDISDGDEKTDWEGYTRDMYNNITSLFTILGAPVNNVVKDIKAILSSGFRAFGNEYTGQYKSLRITDDPRKNSGAYYDLLYKAYKNDKNAFDELKQEMLDYSKNSNDVFTDEKIQKAIEKRMKDEQGVEKVSELDERYVTGTNADAYKEAISYLKTDNEYKRLADKIQEKIDGRVYKWATGSKSADKDTKIIDGGKSVGLTASEYYDMITDAYTYDDEWTTSKKSETAYILTNSKLSSSEKEYIWKNLYPGDEKKKYVSYSDYLSSKSYENWLKKK